MNIGYAYDRREQRHTQAGHPESAARTAAILGHLEQEGTLDRLVQVDIRPADDALLSRIHDADYVRSVIRAEERSAVRLDADTYVCHGSVEAGRLAAGAAATLVREVMGGRLARGMSLMRPPGHHALPGGAMGFCLFSNVAIAARVAQEEFGAERVLILDWDVHHGNGTEAMFYGDASVATVSLHQYPFYPGTGAARDMGEGDGVGATLNVPLPAGVSDHGYLLAMDTVVAPFVRRFAPDLILVSAGYDAHWRDPLAQERLTVRGFAELTRRVATWADDLCDGRLVAVLEGGYDTDALSYAVRATLEVLRDVEAHPVDPLGAPSQDARSAASRGHDEGVDLRPLLDALSAAHAL